MENKLIDKLVLYDFIGILFTGFTVISLSYVLVSWGLLNKFNIDVTFTFTSTLMYTVFSYLIGTALHEVSLFFMKKTIHRKGKPSEIFLEKDIKGFKEYDRQLLKKAIEIQMREYKEYNGGPQLLGREKAYNIYDYCKLYLRQKSIYSYAETMQALYVLSRSLFTFSSFSFTLFPVLYFAKFQHNNYINAALCEVGIIILVIIFYFRSKELADIVVARTLKLFTVHVINEKHG